jgi:hypothetical protein
VPLSGEEIRRRLGEFVEQWRTYQGTERAEAQTFLNQLLACYGTDRGQVARFEEPTGGGFIDLIWPRVCIVEMKRPSQANRLAEHREQALEYWRNAGTPQAPAPRYVVLCAFHTFEVWEPGAIYREPRATFTLEELPDRLDALLFLAGAEPVFVDGQALHIDETVLPLADLSGIQRADALATDWPRADAIIGNPPYHGSQRLRGELGDDYVEWLRREFGIGVKDFAVYWFRKAHERLAAGGRAGLVATNSISQNRNREPSLKWILDTGGVITDAISSQDWSGEAAVDVSIVNWIKDPPSVPVRFMLDHVETMGITAALRSPALDVADAKPLRPNAGRAFQGPMPVGAGFILAAEEAKALWETDGKYRDVVRRYLVGDDIANRWDQAPSRFIIDFGVRRLEEATGYDAALQIVRARVKPERDTNRDRFRREHWWLLGRPVLAMREALSGLDRYIAGIAQGKRIFFAWQVASTCPSNLTNVFAFDDDFAMGVLSSSIHHEWARAQSSTLEDRFRYTPTSAFETYPWPQPRTADRRAVEQASASVIERRRDICQEREIGLTQLYNEVDEGAYGPLAQLHRDLDEAVAAAYAWPASAAHDPAESNRLLLELNRAIAAGELEYRPFDRD